MFPRGKPAGVCGRLLTGLLKRVVGWCGVVCIKWLFPFWWLFTPARDSNGNPPEAERAGGAELE